jgi:hypothetical protein
MQEERQLAGPPAVSRRRKRASLYRPVVLRIANKAAAAVLLPGVNRPCRLTDNGAPRSSPPEDLEAIE